MADANLLSILDSSVSVRDMVKDAKTANLMLK